MTDLWLSGVFFQALDTPKTRFRPGLRPGPRWGSFVTRTYSTFGDRAFGAAGPGQSSITPERRWLVV